MTFSCCYKCTHRKASFVIQPATIMSIHLLLQLTLLLPLSLPCAVVFANPDVSTWLHAAAEYAYRTSAARPCCFWEKTPVFEIAADCFLTHLSSFCIYNLPRPVCSARTSRSAWSVKFFPYTRRYLMLHALKVDAISKLIYWISFLSLSIHNKKWKKGKNNSHMLIEQW